MIFMKSFKPEVIKRGMVILLLLTGVPFLKITAQSPNLDKLNAYKIAFFTRRLNLTPQEAEKFWPVYNEFQDKRNSIQMERQILNRNMYQNELNMSDKDLIDAGDKYVALQVQEAALAQEYHKKFKEILSPIKVIRLYQAENQYRMQLLNELKDKQPIRNSPQQRVPGRNPV
ncbi:MAG: hypothetical protein C0408_09370 [Odoribacter sp.]|nr:hypothetical protein [Odoribacter sp.]